VLNHAIRAACDWIQAGTFYNPPDPPNVALDLHLWPAYRSEEAYRLVTDVLKKKLKAEKRLQPRTLKQAQQDFKHAVPIKDMTNFMPVMQRTERLRFVDEDDERRDVALAFGNPYRLILPKSRSASPSLASADVSQDTWFDPEMAKHRRTRKADKLVDTLNVPRKSASVKLLFPLITSLSFDEWLNGDVKGTWKKYEDAYDDVDLADLPVMVEKDESKALPAKRRLQGELESAVKQLKLEPRPEPEPSMEPVIQLQRKETVEVQDAAFKRQLLAAIRKPGKAAAQNVLAMIDGYQGPDRLERIQEAVTEAKRLKKQQLVQDLSTRLSQ
jgi:hypothetical protein